MPKRLTFKNLKKGVSLPELIIVLSVMGIVSAIVFSVFSSASRGQSLENSAILTLSSLERARAYTLSSKNASQYGVYFASTTATIFKGSTYSAGASTNESVSLAGGARVSAMTVAGGGTSVLFSRLTGETVNNGTITLSLTSNPGTTKVITVYTTGIAESN